MQRSANRILTTHTGSLHRPVDLEGLFRLHVIGAERDVQQLETRLTSAVAEIVDRQIEVGIDAIDDGEFSKVDFLAYAKYRMDGLEARTLQRDEKTGAVPSKYFHSKMQTVMASESVRMRFSDFYKDTVLPDGSQMVQLWTPRGTALEPPAIFACVDRLRYKSHEIDRDIANLKSAVAGRSVVDVFMPGVAPAMFATRHINEAYASEEEYYFAVADVMREEYLAIVNAGFLVQIDDVSLPGAYRLKQGEDFKRWCGLAIDCLNYALRDIPPEKVRYHMCWSSHNTPHTDDAPLAELLEHILRINAQAYHIEAANVRHEHEWKVWKDAKLPDDKILMPGVICHATNVIEHPEYVAERILRYVNLVGRERVVAATDCGFRLRVHPQIAWAKLEALVEGARIATKQLWKQ